MNYRVDRWGAAPTDMVAGAAIPLAFTSTENTGTWPKRSFG